MFGPPIKDLGDVLRNALSTDHKTEDVTENLKVTGISAMDSVE